MVSKVAIATRTCSLLIRSGRVLAVGATARDWGQGELPLKLVHQVFKGVFSRIKQLVGVGLWDQDAPGARLAIAKFCHQMSDDDTVDCQVAHCECAQRGFHTALFGPT